MKLYIIRHGQTEWNIQKRLQGWNNSNLTKKGMQDAENLAARLENVDFDYIYSSPQKRALETANIIKENRDIDIIELEALKEIGFGQWEGMQMKDIHYKYKDEFDTYLNRPHLYKAGLGAESFEDIFKRVGDVLEKILKRNAENVLIVSHGVTIKVLTAIIKEISLEDLSSIPIHRGTALNICQVNNKERKFIVEGDIDHIE